MITLKDVAKAANMSVTQVSRALNGHDDVSEATKNRISKLANELGYVKNMTAKKLAMQVSSEIALVLKGFEDDSNLVEYNSVYPILYGVNKFATTIDHEVVVHIMQDNIKSYVNYFRNKGINKAVLFGFQYDDPRLKGLVESSIDCVFIDIPITGEHNGCIIVNNTQYAAQAVEALIHSGKKQIALINGTPHAVVSIEREAGYKIALAKERLEPTAIACANFNKKEAYEVTLKMMEENPEIDAIFCASDYMALGCMEALDILGKKIPEDIAVIGYDNIPVSAYTRPSLSTVAQDDYQKGYQAAKLLYEMANKETENRTITLNCNVIMRESV